MYLLFSLHILRAPRHICSKQLTPRIFSSHEILTKLQKDTTKDNINGQEKPSAVIQNLQNVNEFSKLSNAATGTLSVSDKILQKCENKENFNISNVKWKEIQVDSSQLKHHYLKLSKFRLTSLVVLTSMMGYAMNPSSFNMISFLSCAIGTGLVSSAANSVNQFLEIPFDAQMSRTRNRVLVQGHLSSLHAVGFATAAGSLGLLILYHGANSLTATLGAANLILYTMIYTPLKRISILNTWVGSIVGAIPPLMGWAACDGSLEAKAFILGAILYAWQFPHFNALSWNLRPDYSKAGYRMMAVTNPGLCRRTALRYTVVVAICSGLAPVLNLTHWSFAVLSAPVNLYFMYLGVKFFKESDSKNSRKLFRFSLIHLPLLLGLMLVTKQSLYLVDGEKVKEKENLIFQEHDEKSVQLFRNFNSTPEQQIFSTQHTTLSL